VKIYLASDHGGFEYKKNLMPFIEGLGFEVEDCGAQNLDPDDDYPDFIIPACEKMVEDLGSMGIILGRSGNGEAIAANKVVGVRAAVCTSVEMVIKAREHNDANVLSIGADYVSLGLAREMVETFLKTLFSGDGRHTERIRKISEYELSQKSKA
jgi:ribose 5-phosphate isomerase B